MIVSIIRYPHFVIHSVFCKSNSTLSIAFCSVIAAYLVDSCTHLNEDKLENPLFLAVSI